MPRNNRKSDHGFVFSEVPTTEFPYFLYDPEDFKFFYFRNERDRSDYLKMVIFDEYLHKDTGVVDGAIEMVVAGVVTHGVVRGDRSCALAHLAEFEDGPLS